MAIVITLATGVCMVLSVTAIVHGVECDFTAIDLDSAVAKLLSKLPEDLAPFGHRYRKAFEGVETEAFAVTGLNRVLHNGPLLPYCINNTRMLKVELVSERDTFLSLPWRTCTGHEGALLVKPDISRWTVLLRVESQGFGDKVKLVYEGPILPLSMENIKFEITGFGDGWVEKTSIISTFIPGITQRVWHDYFSLYFEIAIRQALSETFQ